MGKLKIKHPGFLPDGCAGILAIFLVALLIGIANSCPAQTTKSYTFNVLEATVCESYDYVTHELDCGIYVPMESMMIVLKGNLMYWYIDGDTFIYTQTSFSKKKHNGYVQGYVRTDEWGRMHQCSLDATVTPSGDAYMAIVFRDKTYVLRVYLL